jgi:hypothetical protein
MDVMAIALNRFRQQSFHLPPYLDPGFNSGRDRLTTEYNEILRAVFPTSDIAFQHTAARHAHAAVADLAKLGSKDEEAVGQAATWLANVGWFMIPRTAPKGPDEPVWKSFNEQGYELAQISTVRSRLFAALARVGKNVPDWVVQRISICCYSWPQDGKTPITQKELLNWVRETEPYAGSGVRQVSLENKRREGITADAWLLKLPRPAAADDWAGQLREFAGVTEALAETLSYVVEFQTVQPPRPDAKTIRERWQLARHLGGQVRELPPDEPEVTSMVGMRNALYSLAFWARQTADKVESNCKRLPLCETSETIGPLANDTVATVEPLPIGNPGVRLLESQLERMAGAAKAGFPAGDVDQQFEEYDRTVSAALSEMTLLRNSWRGGIGYFGSGIGNAVRVAFHQAVAQNWGACTESLGKAVVAVRSFRLPQSSQSQASNETRLLRLLLIDLELLSDQIQRLDDVDNARVRNAARITSHNNRVPVLALKVRESAGASWLLPLLSRIKWPDASAWFHRLHVDLNPPALVAEASREQLRNSISRIIQDLMRLHAMIAGDPPLDQPPDPSHSDTTSRSARLQELVSVLDETAQSLDSAAHAIEDRPFHESGYPPMGDPTVQRLWKTYLEKANRSRTLVNAAANWLPALAARHGRSVPGEWTEEFIQLLAFGIAAGPNQHGADGLRTQAARLRERWGFLTRLLDYEANTVEVISWPDSSHSIPTAMQSGPSLQESSPNRPANLKPDQFLLRDDVIAFDLTPKHLQLLTALKPAGSAGVSEQKLFTLLNYPDPVKGQRALSQLVARLNEKLSGLQFLVEKVNGYYCLTCTDSGR